MPSTCTGSASATPVPTSWYIPPGGSKSFTVNANVTTNSNVPTNCSPQHQLLGGSVKLKATQSAAVVTSVGCLAPWASLGSHSQMVPVQFTVPSEGTWAISTVQVKPWWTQADATADPDCH